MIINFLIIIQDKMDKILVIAGPCVIESEENAMYIAEKMKKSPKAIDNALQRIKAKIRVFQNDTLPS